MNFVSLYRKLDSSNSTLDKIEALREHFLNADVEETALAMRLILGQLPPKKAKSAELKALALDQARIPEWLFAEAYSSTGDLAETMALINAVPDAPPFTGSVPEWIKTHLRGADEALSGLREAFSKWDSFSVMVLIKLLTGSLRVGVSRGILIKALAKAYEIPEANIAHVLMGNLKIDASFIGRLKMKDWADPLDFSSPYPFALASPIDGEIEDLGPITDWAIEWKWDGIRGQWIYRNEKVSLWSRGEELISDRFPEFATRSLKFESLVLDGEILAWKPGAKEPSAFALLQTRIARKKVTEADLKKAPARFIAYDCVEKDGVDLRELPFSERRKILEELMPELTASIPAFGISEIQNEESWTSAKASRAGSREKRVEGFILKRKSSPYFHGRKKGDWWKWKIDTMSLDAVMVYAQSGHGKRSNLFTDYTFALRGADDELVPVAKAYSGLDQKEIMELDRWIRAHTKERFGPVRSVEPIQVFELGFEGIADSPRHKSGIALRFPRILRWRRDKPVSEIDRLDAIRELYLKPDIEPVSREELPLFKSANLDV
ncbi:MAG: ATP-dependent DNA ligase [Cryobacterium sp.]|nr:ATP-dependent DNA ligase [Oligoflexia bacterium]